MIPTPTTNYKNIMVNQKWVFKKILLGKLSKHLVLKNLLFFKMKSSETVSVKNIYALPNNKLASNDIKYKETSISLTVSWELS